MLRGEIAWMGGGKTRGSGEWICMLGLVSSYNTSRLPTTPRRIIMTRCAVLGACVRGVGCDDAEVRSVLCST